MTPVYDVALADRNTKNCRVNSHTARERLCVLLSKYDRIIQIPPHVEKHCISYSSEQLKKNAPHIFHLLLSETRKRFLKEFKAQRIFLAATGTNVLWRQAKFDLKATNYESTVLDGYIKEQPADHPTTATDEEK